MCASLNHRKKKKAESSHPIPRKLTPNQWRSKGGLRGPWAPGGTLWGRHFFDTN